MVFDALNPLAQLRLQDAPVENYVIIISSYQQFRWQKNNNQSQLSGEGMNLILVQK